MGITEPRRHDSPDRFPQVRTSEGRSRGGSSRYDESSQHERGSHHAYVDTNDHYADPRNDRYDNHSRARSDRDHRYRRETAYRSAHPTEERPAPWLDREYGRQPYAGHNVYEHQTHRHGYEIDHIRPLETDSHRFEEIPSEDVGDAPRGTVPPSSQRQQATLPPGQPNHQRHHRRHHDFTDMEPGEVSSLSDLLPTRISRPSDP
jgi:hypothetical protein